MNGLHPLTTGTLIFSTLVGLMRIVILWIGITIGSSLAANTSASGAESLAHASPFVLLRFRRSPGKGMSQVVGI
jgi:hypothetical protein